MNSPATFIHKSVKVMDKEKKSYEEGFFPQITGKKKETATPPKNKTGALQGPGTAAESN